MPDDLKLSVSSIVATFLGLAFAGWIMWASNCNYENNSRISVLESKMTTIEASTLQTQKIVTQVEKQISGMSAILGEIREDQKRRRAKE